MNENANNANSHLLKLVKKILICILTELIIENNDLHYLRYLRLIKTHN